MFVAYDFLLVVPYALIIIWMKQSELLTKQLLFISQYLQNKKCYKNEIFTSISYPNTKYYDCEGLIEDSTFT